MNAMIISTVDSSILKQLLETALTAKINEREMFMKGIDYSYYYEEGYQQVLEIPTYLTKKKYLSAAADSFFYSRKGR